MLPAPQISDAELEEVRMYVYIHVSCYIVYTHVCNTVMFGYIYMHVFIG